MFLLRNEIAKIAKEKKNIYLWILVDDKLSCGRKKNLRRIFESCGDGALSFSKEENSIPT